MWERFREDVKESGREVFWKGVRKFGREGGTVEYWRE